MKKILQFLLLSFLILAPVVNAQSNKEKITNFNQEIKINLDGSLNVREEITVVTNQEIFKHGIYRDFFTNKQNGNLRNQRYIINSVLINESLTKYKTVIENDYKRIYIGNPDILLEPGIYKFTIDYTALNSESYFDSYEELFWNVNGEWGVPIDKISGKIIFPQEITDRDIKVIGFIGKFGSKNRFSNYQIQENEILFESDRKLNINENISVAISFPKGTFTGNTDYQNLREKLIYISLISINLLTVLIVLFIFKNNKADERIFNAPVTFDIPKDMSPSEFRYLYRDKVDYKSLSSELIQLSINKVIKIERIVTDNFLGFSKKDDFQFTRISEEEPTSKLQKYILSRLFTKNKISTNDEEDGDKFAKAADKLESEMELKDFYYSKLGDFRKWIFIQRGVIVFFYILILMIVIPAILSILRVDDLATAFVSSAFGLMFSFLPYKIIIKNLKLYGEIKYYLIFFAYISFLIFWFVFVVRQDNYKFFILTSFLPFIIYEFINSFDNLTEKGIENMVILMGFRKFAKSQKDYLGGVENSLPLTLNMYEKYLPYAIAIDVETSWSKKFAEVLQFKGNESNINENYVYLNSNSFNKSIKDTIENSNFSNLASGSGGGSSSGFSSGGSSGGGGGSRGGGGW